MKKYIKLLVLQMSCYDWNINNPFKKVNWLSLNAILNFDTIKKTSNTLSDNSEKIILASGN